MNENIQNLLNLIKENPELKIVPMVNYEIVAGDDCSYWMTSFGKCEVTKIYNDDERIWFEDDFDDLVDKFIENNYCEVEIEAEEIVKNYNWEKVIVVYIELP
jgi:hypothetical protein